MCLHPMTPSGAVSSSQLPPAHAASFLGRRLTHTSSPLPSRMQIFEAYGLGDDVIETCFRGSVSRIAGMSLSDLQVRVGQMGR